MCPSNGYPLNQLENRGSKPFTELNNMENWASYGQK